MNNAGDFDVFSKWADAPSYAFGGRGVQGIVPEGDREAYWRIYQDLMAAAKVAVENHPDGRGMYLRPKMYSRDRGSRGIDLVIFGFRFAWMAPSS